MWHSGAVLSAQASSEPTVTHTKFSGLQNGGTKNVPRLQEPRLRLVPVARVKQALYIEHVVVANRDDAGQLSNSVMKLLRKIIGGHSRKALELLLHVIVGMLDAAGANHGQQARELKRQGPILGVPLPPYMVVLEEVGRVDDVIMIIDIVVERVDEFV